MNKNNSYLNCKKIDTAISRATKLLIKEAKKNGLYENFGRNEVRKISEKFIDLSDYSKEMNIKRIKLDYFSNWCASYNLQDIRFNR